MVHCLRDSAIQSQRIQYCRNSAMGVRQTGQLPTCGPRYVDSTQLSMFAVSLDCRHLWVMNVASTRCVVSVGNARRCKTGSVTKGIVMAAASFRERGQRHPTEIASLACVLTMTLRHSHVAYKLHLFPLACNELFY